MSHNVRQPKPRELMHSTKIGSGSSMSHTVRQPKPRELMHSTKIGSGSSMSHTVRQPKPRELIHSTKIGSGSSMIYTVRQPKPRVCVQDLRTRTRIFVPEAALLMGVVDELGVLEYGQVFIQVDRSLTLDSPTIIQGDIIMAKNPCFHPGDVRILQVRPPCCHLLIKHMPSN